MKRGLCVLRLGLLRFGAQGLWSRAQGLGNEGTDKRMETIILGFPEIRDTILGGVPRIRICVIWGPIGSMSGAPLN